MTHRSASRLSEHSTDALSLSPGDDLVDLLGADPSTSFLLHEQIARRWNHITLKGLDKEARQDLFNRYHKPGNCCLDAPVINPELNLSLGKSLLSKDGYYANLQSRLGVGLAALGKSMNSILSDQNFANIKDLLLPGLSDTARILLDLFFSMSLQRRALITSLLSKSVKEVVKKGIPDKFLFGPDHEERLKVVQSLERSAKDLLVNKVPSNVTVAVQNSTSFCGHLNKRGPTNSARGARQMRDGAQDKYVRNRYHPQEHQRTNQRQSNRFSRNLRR